MRELLLAQLQTRFPDARIDLEGEGCNLHCTIVSPAFNGQTTLARQRQVFSVVTNFLQDGSVHAFSMKLFTPEEWEHEK